MILFKNSVRRISIGVVFGMGILLSRPEAGISRDYERSCRAVLEIRQNDTNHYVRGYEFVVKNTVSHYAQVNDARREIRRAITNCMQTHWNDRDSGNRPVACQTSGSMDFSQYPFDNLETRIHDDLCGTNPDALRMDVDIILFIDGERGCVENGGNINPATRVDLASSYRINCPIRDGGGEEQGTRPEEAPLPNTRLPGHDISSTWISNEPWQHCRDLCESNNACMAWTYRAAGFNGSRNEALCLQKNAESTHVSDSCCQSGIKE
jgi:hypothetical protein